MTRTTLSEKMACQLAKNNMSRCCNSSSRSMVGRWINMEKRQWDNSNIKKIRNQKRTPSKIKFKRLNKFVLIMMHCLEILSSQLMILRCTRIQPSLQNMQWICQWSNGRDHKKLSHKIQPQSCTETQ